MEAPEFLYICQSCFRCVQDCTKGIFSRAINPEYRTLGDDYWTAEIISQIWYQAHTGKIPVSGTGYRGPFVGPGFDAMWTDMSEIVRPTRDGIHGREYINTSIELSRRPMRLKFGSDKSLAGRLPPILEIPLPITFQQPSYGVIDEPVLLTMARTAHRLGTMMFLQPQAYTEAFTRYASHLVPCLTGDNYRDYSHLLGHSRMVELADRPGVDAEFAELRRMQPGLVIAVGIPLDATARDRTLDLVDSDVDTLHFYADDYGNQRNTAQPQFLKELIRDIHTALVAHGQRPKVNLLFSGGIAMAEHIAKAIICGADGVSLDTPLLIALECRHCQRCADGDPCPVNLNGIAPEWGMQRILNLMAAWRNQLIEVLGAMGIREARRLRGEVGRSLWFENLERECFGPIFGTRQAIK